MVRDKKWISSILEANKNKGFVQRMFSENPMTLDLGDGNHATHMMSWGQTDNGYVVFPTVLFNGKALQAFTPQDAINHALATGNYIQFDNQDDADFFSANYKTALKNKIFR